MGHYHHVSADIDGTIVRRKVIGARGWELICQIAGVSFIKPGEALSIERENGSVSYVRIREMLIGRGENGNLRCIDLTLNYDVAGRLSTDLFDKWCEDGNPEWGILANAERAEAIVKEDGAKGRIAIPGGNYLVYSLANMEVVKLLRSHSQWSFSADRSAATIVERNLARRYFGFTDADADGCVEFTSWVGADVDFNSIKISDGILSVASDTLVIEQAEEQSSEVVDEESFEKNMDIPALIKGQARRLGGWQKARSLCKEVCEEHNIKWGDIGTTKNEQGLQAIYKALKAL